MAELAVQQDRVGLSSPLRAAGQLVYLRGTCWALELTERSKLGGLPVLHQLAMHQLGQRASQARQAR